MSSYASVAENEDGSVDLVNNYGSFHVNPGTKCIIKPPNPSKKKHRDRVCEFRGVINNHAQWLFVASVKFLDTGKLGRCEFNELVPYEIGKSISLPVAKEKAKKPSKLADFPPETQKFINAMIATVEGMNVDSDDPTELMQAVFDNLGNLVARAEKLEQSEFGSGYILGLVMAQVLAGKQFEDYIEFPD